MKGDGVLVDDETRQPVTNIQEIINEWGETIEMARDLQRGLFHLSLEEYRKSPAVFIDVLRIIKEWPRKDK